MTISSQTRKAGPYSGNGSTTTFPFAFKVFSASDVLVVRANSSGVETVLTLGTDYTVSLNSNQDSNAGGNVVMNTAPASGYTLTIGSQVPQLQQTDFTNQGGFYPKVLNAALDKVTILVQQLAEQVSRAAKLPISNTTDADALTAAILQVANDKANIDAVAGDLTNIDAVKNNKTNIDTVAGISANVSTVAGISTDVTAVAGNNTNITAVKNNATNINTVAGIAANVTTVAGISANVTSVAGNATNINAVAGNNTNITAVAGNATNINAVNANKTNIDAVAGNATNINTVASNATNIATTVANMAAIVDAPNQATAAAASAAAAAASAASGMYSSVQDKSASYTVVAADAGDLIRVNTSGGARTITLPQISGTGIGDGFKIAVVKWTSDGNAVTIARSGSDTINGQTSYSLGNQYSSATFVADLETSQWFAAASGLGTSNVNVDVFSGNGSTTAFTLSGDAGNKNNTAVMIGGVYQAKSTYSISGTTLTFTSAPPSGTSNIEVVWNSPIAIGTPSDGTVTTAKLAGGTVNTTADIGANGLTVGKGAGSVATNTAVGASALAANTSGATSTAIGSESLKAQTTGSYNTALGRQSGYNITTGVRNTVIGESAYWSGTTGNYNTVVGNEALSANTTASNNTAVGFQAGYSVTGNGGGVFIGANAGRTTTDAYNVFIGYGAGYTANIGGGNGYNTYVGTNAGYLATTGSVNTFIGAYAGYSVTSGSKHTIIGNYSGNVGGLDIRTASNYIVLSDGDGNPNLQIDSSANLKFNSGYGSVATAYGCRAWVNFNGTGTVAIRASGNVSSITDQGVGLYQVNMTNAMPDAAYCVSGTSYISTATTTGTVGLTMTGGNVLYTTSFSIGTIGNGGTDAYLDALVTTVEVVR